MMWKRFYMPLIWYGPDIQAGGGENCSSSYGNKDESAVNLPVIEKARRITADFVEVYFNDYYKDQEHPDLSEFVFEKKDGTDLPLRRDYGYGGAVFFNNILTVKLLDSLSEDENAEELVMKYKGKEYIVPYDSYYKYVLKTNCGMIIKGSRALSRGNETLAKAGKMVDVLLKIRPDIVNKMNEAGGYFAVYGKGEHAYMIPEYRIDYDPKMRYVEGFGGLPCSITECNVWRWTKETAPDPDYTTIYTNESVLTHEFGHGIKLLGMDLLPDQSLAHEFQMVYRHSKASGLWPASYAISNSDEFFATLSTIWFNVMSESKGNDVWDGTRGPVNTRKELYNYDRDAYNFFSKIYPFEFMPDEWSGTPDRFTVTGLGTEEPVDMTGKDRDFNCPESVSGEKINFTDKFKIINALTGRIIDTNMSETNACLYWDYSKVHPEKAAPMFYTFEKVGNGEALKKDGKTTVKVYIRNEENGYVYSYNGKIVTAKNMETVPENPTEFTVTTDEENISTISCSDGFVKSNGDTDGFPIMIANKAGRWRIEKISENNLAVFVHDCTADGNRKGIMTSKGHEVQLEADPAPEGKHFVGWEVKGGTAENASDKNTKLIMPDNDVVVRAVYAE